MNTIYFVRAFPNNIPGAQLAQELNIASQKGWDVVSVSHDATLGFLVTVRRPSGTVDVNRLSDNTW